MKSSEKIAPPLRIRRQRPIPNPEPVPEIPRPVRPCRPAGQADHAKVADVARDVGRLIAEAGVTALVDAKDVIYAVGAPEGDRMEHTEGRHVVIDGFSMIHVDEKGRYRNFVLRDEDGVFVRRKFANSTHNFSSTLKLYVAVHRAVEQILYGRLKKSATRIVAEGE